MATVSPYIRVLQQQLINSLAKLMSFRFSFVLLILSDLTSVVTVYLSNDFLFRHVDAIGSWHRDEFMFFSFWMLTITNLHTIFMAPNFWNFSEEITNGRLDFRLLRPLGTLFDVFMAITRPISAIVLPVTVGGLIHFGRALHLSTLAWWVMPFLFVVSFAGVLLVEILIAMAMLWTINGDGINFLRIQCQQVQKWPDFVYPSTFRLMFTRAVPVLAFSTFSVRALLGDGAWWEVPFLVIAVVVLWFLIGVVWRMGLRRYESASS